MNEHDSERIAGLLEADGLEPADVGRRRRRRRAQHLLHPRERRQQALRHPRPPQDGEGRSAPSLQIVVAGCLAQKDRDLVRAAGAVTSTSCSAPTTCTAPPSSSTRPARDGPVTEILDEAVLDDHDAVPVGAAGAARDVAYNAWVTIQIGCDNSLRLLHRARRCAAARSAARSATSSPRSSALAADGVIEVTLLGQNVNSYGRDLHAGRPPGRRRPTRACGRCSPTCSRAVGAVDGHPPGPLHQPAPEGPAARDDRGHGRDAGGVRAPAPPLQSGSDRVLAAMHRGYTAERYLERLAARPRGRRRPGRHHRHHRRLPRRDRRRLRAHPRGRRRGRVRLRLHVHLLAPPGHRGGRRWPTHFVDPAVCAERFERLRVVVERVGAGPAPGPGRPRRGGARRGPEQEGPVGASPAAPARTSSSTSRRPRRCAPGTYATVEVTGAGAAPPAWASCVEVTAEPHAQDAHPRRRRLSVDAGRVAPARARWPSSGPTASGKSRPSAHRRCARAAGRAPSSSPSTRCRSTGAWTSARPSRRRPSRPRCRTTASTWSTRARTSRSPSFQRGRRRGAGRHRRPGRPGASSWRAPASTCGRSSTGSTSPGSGPTCAPSSRPSPTPSALHRRLAELDPVGRRQDGADQPAPRRAGPRGHARQRPPVLLVRPGPRRLPADRRSRRSGCAGRGRLLAERIDAALRRDARRRLPRRGRRAGGRAGRLSRTAAPGPRLQGAARPPARRVLARRGDRAGRRPAPASSPCARSAGSGATPAYAGSRCDDDPVAAALAGPRASPPLMTDLTLTKHHGLGNDFLVAVRRAGRAGRSASDDLARRLCDRRRGIGADGLLVATTSRPPAAIARRRPSTMVIACSTPTAAGPR